MNVSFGIRNAINIKAFNQSGSLSNFTTLRATDRLDREKSILLFITTVMLVVSVFGTISNCLSIFIFAHPQMRSTTNKILQAIAITDTIYLLHLLLYAIIAINTLVDPVFGAHPKATVSPILVAYTPIVTLRSTTWLTVFVTVKRCSDIYFPLSVVTVAKWTSRDIVVASFSIVFITALVYIPMGVRLETIHNKNHTNCYVQDSNVGRNHMFYLTYQFILDVFFCYLPLVIIFLLNFFITYGLRLVWNMKSLYRTTGRRIKKIRKFEQTRVTIMIVLMSSIQVLSLLPEAVYKQVIKQDQLHSPIDTQNSSFVIHLPVYLSSMGKFFLYASFSRYFKSVLKFKFCCAEQNRSSKTLKHAICETRNRLNISPVDDLNSENSSSLEIYHLKELQEYVAKNGALNRYTGKDETLAPQRTSKSESIIRIRLSSRPFIVFFWQREESLSDDELNVAFNTPPFSLKEV